MCSLVPFATTTAILASSMTLVGIAVDRYFAVMKAVTGFWKPSVINCIVCVLCIWLASIGISCPVFAIYNIIPVYILAEEQETATTEATTLTTDAKITKTVLMIMTPKKPTINATIKPLPPPTLKIIGTGTESSSEWQNHASQEDLSFTLVCEEELVNMCVSNQVRFNCICICLCMVCVCVCGCRILIYSYDMHQHMLHTCYLQVGV